MRLLVMLPKLGLDFSSAERCRWKDAGTACVEDAVGCTINQKSLVMERVERSSLLFRIDRRFVSSVNILLLLFFP
jgi:hypothetical protein